MKQSPVHALAADETTLGMLSQIADRYGTPTYAYDLRVLRAQVDELREHLPREVEVLYSLKANASLGLCDVFAEAGIGADVASAGELAIAVEAGFPAERIFVAGPFKLAETVSQLRELPEAIVSVDSPDELAWLAQQELANRIVLRLRPDFASSAVVAAGSESRFGFTGDDLAWCREFLPTGAVKVIGFHIFAGSQVLRSSAVVEHLRRAWDLARRAAEVLGITPSLVNLGGGFGVPYGPGDETLDLGPIGEELERLLERSVPARLVLELGRFLVAGAGWYLTTVVGHQTNLGRPAVIVDGGTHQRADLCGLCLRTKANPPVVLNAATTSLETTDVLGCLSLPADVLAESARLPRLERGNVLAFGNAGAYGLWSSPAMFHGSALPAEVAFDEAALYPMRERRPADSVLQDQRHVIHRQLTACS